MDNSTGCEQTVTLYKTRMLFMKNNMYQVLVEHHFFFMITIWSVNMVIWCLLGLASFSVNLECEYDCFRFTWSIWVFLWLIWVFIQLLILLHTCVRFLQFLLVSLSAFLIVKALLFHCVILKNYICPSNNRYLVSPNTWACLFVFVFNEDFP